MDNLSSTSCPATAAAGASSDQSSHPRFQVVGAATFLRLADSLALASGIYGLLLRGAGSVLGESGYDGPSPYEIGDFVHIYTGASYELGKRVPLHLIGSVRKSNFRETLHAIDFFTNGAVRRLIAEDELSDEALTRWMMSNALVGFRRCSEPKSHEKALLRSVASPLNIEERKAETYARRLIAMRRAAAGSPVPSCCWQAAEDLFTTTKGELYVC